MRKVEYNEQDWDDAMESVHMNDHYIVLINEDEELTEQGVTYTGIYEVINRATQLVEFKGVSMPQAISVAENMCHALVTEPWNWRKGEEEAAPPPTVN